MIAKTLRTGNTAFFRPQESFGFNKVSWYITVKWYITVNVDYRRQIGDRYKGEDSRWRRAFCP
jgi:hypothetical protein